MSKKFLAALLAVLMVLSIVPMTALAAETPKEVVAASLTYREGESAPAYGQASRYEASLARDTDGTRRVTVTARDLVMSVNPGSEVDPATASYKVGVGIKIDDTNKIWAYTSNSPIPGNSNLSPSDFRFWPNVDPYNFRQTTDGQLYATFYTQGTIAGLNAKTWYICILTENPSNGLTEAVLKTRRDYVVTFDLAIPVATHKLTVMQAEGGTITVKAGDDVIEGEAQVTENQHVSVKATPDTGKQIKKVFYTVDGVETEVAINPELAGEYTFNMPNKDAVVSAEFEEGPAKTITKDTMTNGTVTVAESAAYNTAVTITPVAYSGYRPTGVVYYKIESSDEQIRVYPDENGEYTFTMPNDAVEVGATFEAIPVDPTPHTITVTTPDAANGTITVTPQSAIAGTQITVTVTPGTGKAVENVTVAATSEGSNATANVQEGNTYVFMMPDNDVTVSATFANAEAHTVTATVEATDGSITFSPTAEDNKYYKGDVVTVNVVPAEGKVVEKVEYTPADGAATEIPLVNGKYSFTMPDKNVEVTVTFGNVELYDITCTATPAEGGTVTASKERAVAGDIVTVTVTPNPNCTVDSVTVVKTESGDEVALDSDTNTFTMPDEDVTVTATFIVPITHPNGSGTTTVDPNAPTVTLTPDTTGNYTLAFDKTAAKAGEQVTVTVTPDEGTPAYYVVSAVTAKGDTTATATKNANGTFTFTMPAGNTVTVSATISHIFDLFQDVPADAFYAAPVKWAVEKNITLGTDPVNYSTFGPTASCTRAQMVVFLYRAAGSPDVTGTTNSFTDLPADEEIRKAIQWAVDNGITQGTSDTTFAPNNVCDRGQMVTFLYRYDKEPAVTGSNSFVDVPADAFYKIPVQWAADKDITQGTNADGTIFAPNNVCDRGQMVTFLYRYMGE